MPDDARILELVEEVLDSNRTPEEVCAREPELLADVEACLKECRGVRFLIDDMFPTTPLEDDSGAQSGTGERLPTIPGYEVLDVLGRGGNGIIYRVRHLKLDRVVALKMLLSGGYAGPAEVARFLREARSVAALQHPNIVQVYDVGEVEGCPYFTMELVSGGSLAGKLAGVPQTAHYSASLIETIARAVAFAHTAGFIHRDIKPANVLLTADGTAKVSDFGLARHFEGPSDVTLGAARVGTPSYMPPEQVTGKPGTVGPPADVYGLGATIYEMLTGRPPFRGESAAETERQLLSREPVPPSQLNAKVPRDLETICLKCLQKEPTRRYATADALADDLKRFNEGRPIHARPVGWAERSWRWCKRNPTAAGFLLTAIALVGLASGGGTWFFQQRARHQIELRSDIGATMTQAANLRKGFHFREAQGLLDQAQQRLEPSGPAELRAQVQHAMDDVHLVERLEKARLHAASVMRGTYDFSGSERLFTAAFTESGLLHEGEDPTVVAERIRKSELREDLIGALDDWAVDINDEVGGRARQEWILTIARKADENESRNRLRHAEVWEEVQQKNPVALKGLIDNANAAELTPHLAATLMLVVRVGNGDPAAFLTSVVQRFPQDFWLNEQLANALSDSQRWAEALSYYRAALALRPDLSVAYDGVSVGLRGLKRIDEAIDQLRQALRIDPGDLYAHQLIGGALLAKGLRQEAVDHFQVVLSNDPNIGIAHYTLAIALIEMGRGDEALGHLRQAVRIEPDAPLGLYHLGNLLNQMGRHEEAIEPLRHLIESNPGNAKALPGAALLYNSLFALAHADLRTAASPGTGNRSPADSERAGLRMHALDRLRECLELTTKLQKEGKSPEWSLSIWKTDPILATVREPSALAKFPDAEREQWQRFWTDVATGFAIDPLEQGRMFATRGEWGQAADGYARALKRSSTNNGHFWYEYAALSLLANDRSGYTRACSHLIETADKPGGPRGYHVARACTLAPDAVRDASLPGRVAANELRASATQFWSLTEQGALAYRAGKIEESATLFEQSLKADGQPGRAVVNWVWLALAEQRLGKTDEARRWLEKAQSFLDHYRDGLPPRADAETGLHYHNWLEANVLRREAEAALSSK
jgi:serine/threonine-protein kinase